VRAAANVLHEWYAGIAAPSALAEATAGLMLPPLLAAAEGSGVSVYPPLPAAAADDGQHEPVPPAPRLPLCALQAMMAQAAWGRRAPLLQLRAARRRQADEEFEAAQRATKE
jgi:hypothetical protein